jgi:nucleoside-diphosphate-sugar epimerase
MSDDKRFAAEREQQPNNRKGEIQAMNDKIIRNVMVTGGGGYVGSRLVPKLLAEGHKVTVLDLFIYGKDVLADCLDNPNLRCVQGDLRDPGVVADALKGNDCVIHLACISNDPSFELDPGLGKSINYDCFRPLVRASKEAGVNRFIYASSSSVYGIKDEDNVTEDLTLEPLTDYSKFKAMCEDVLLEEREPGFVTLILRPATVCGYAPRLRLDLTVNILTNHAINNGRITVFGGNQKRPNINIEDMTDLYINCLQYDDEAIDGKIFNAGYENHSVMQIAEMVRENVGNGVEIMTTPTDDNRSYHVSSELIKRELGFVPRHSIEDAVASLATAFAAGKISDPMENPIYYNVKLMQDIELH